MIYATKLFSGERRNHPRVVAIIPHRDIAWPFTSTDGAREAAKTVGAFGFWRLKEAGR